MKHLPDRCGTGAAGLRSGMRDTAPVGSLLPSLHSTRHPPCAEGSPSPKAQRIQNPFCASPGKRLFPYIHTCPYLSCFQDTPPHLSAAAAIFKPAPTASGEGDPHPEVISGSLTQRRPPPAGEGPAPAVRSGAAGSLPRPGPHLSSSWSRFSSRRLDRSAMDVER